MSLIETNIQIEGKSLNSQDNVSNKPEKLSKLSKSSKQSLIEIDDGEDAPQYKKNPNFIKNLAEKIRKANRKKEQKLMLSRKMSGDVLFFL